MNVLVNLLLAVLAFIIARTVLAFIGLDGFVGWIISVIIAIFVFLQNWAERLNG